MRSDRTDRGAAAPTMVTASALGSYVFCPEAARLAFLGVRPSSQARQNMARGEAAHGRWQQQEDRAPARERRMGRLVLLVAAVLALLALIWAMTGP